MLYLQSNWRKVPFSVKGKQSQKNICLYPQLKIVVKFHFLKWRAPSYYLLYWLILPPLKKFLFTFRNCCIFCKSLLPTSSYSVLVSDTFGQGLWNSKLQKFTGISKLLLLFLKHSAGSPVAGITNAMKETAPGIPIYFFF